jgi:hypothetical protein
MINEADITFDGLDLKVEYDYYPAERREERTLLEVTGIRIMQREEEVEISDLLSEATKVRIDEHVLQFCEDAESDWADEVDRRYDEMRDQMMMDGEDR